MRVRVAPWERVARTGRRPGVPRRGGEVFRLTAEQEALKERAADLAAEAFADDAFTWEGEYPRENQQTLADEGLALPEAYGGGGYTPVESLLAQEAVGRVCPDTAHVLSRSSMGPPRVIAELGSDYLKERYLPGVCAGETVMSVAISERGAGTDVGSMTTGVERDGDEVVLNGAKCWVGKSERADAFLVYGRFPDDNVERCHNAMMCVSCGLNAFDKAMAYAKEREQFDQPVADFQGIEWKFTDMGWKLEAARLLVYRAAVNARHRDPSRLETSMAKVVANEFGGEVVDDALQICGARGYMKRHAIEYLYRWVRGWRIAGGTTEVQRNMIARDLKKHGLD